MKTQSNFLGKAAGLTRSRRGGQHRRGSFFVWCAFLLVILLGMTGLVIDGGLMMATYRHAHNAADAAAMAAAYDLFRGRTSDDAVETGTTFGTTNNNLDSATADIAIPPATGPYAGNQQFAEAQVTVPLQSYFIQVLPGFSAGDITARAVAGYEDRPFGYGIITLDPNAGPGFQAAGNGTVTIYGDAAINSEYGGLDEDGNPVNSPLGGNAVEVNGNSNVYIDGDFNVVGGVNNPNRIHDLAGGPSPLHANSLPTPDPFAFFPPPTTANDSSNVVATPFNNPNISGGTVTLQPGVYTNGITISGKANVTFAPGVYVLKGGGMQVSGQANVTAHDVMIYNTGHDYNVNTGFPDTGDGDGPAPNPTNSQFGPMTFSGQGRLDFAALDDTNSPFHGMLIYQRRANTQPFTVSGNSTYRSFAGMIYAKWARLAISGNGGMDARAVVGSFAVSGNGTVRLGNNGTTVPKVREVFLVE